jgi:hypothetical protein
MVWKLLVCSSLEIIIARTTKKGQGKIFPLSQTVEKASQSFLREQKIKFKYFLSGRVPDRKYFSGCKCGICLPQADKLCTQQTAKNWRKSPKGFFDKLG